ncbi:RNA polymerase II transcription elongation factor-domain-containing protein [Phellopilus nigrolimitatus]|nr:RNA polymerase II transcription elongation factor-domain-containing protein [Phellopilus nigrolimitatus]
MSTDWAPPRGRHQVSMGGSMTRFLKQRKGIQQTKQNKAMPTSNYYHFRYNFMPESVDNTKPGVVEVTQSTDITNVRAERASVQPDEVHIFRGKEEPSKEIECVLIYDEESGMFTLEKLDSSLILQHDGRGPPKARAPSASPFPTPSPAASASKAVDDEFTAELFRELESTLAEDDADGEKEDSIPLSVATRPQPSSSRRPEPFRPPPTDAANGKPKPKLRGAAATNAISNPKPAKPSPLVHSLPPVPTPSNPATPVVAPPSVGTRRSGKGKAADSHAIDVEEEELEFGQPARQMKFARISPPALSLPGSSSANALALPASSSGLALPTAGGTVALAPPLPGPEEDEDDDDDEDGGWDKVAGDGVSAGADADATAAIEESIFGDGFGEAEDGNEINLDQFVAEMDEELLGELEDEGEADGEADGDDIFGDADKEPARPLKPMSLNQFAGGGVDDADDDYSSSSDDSDDD